MFKNSQTTSQTLEVSKVAEELKEKISYFGKKEEEARCAAEGSEKRAEKAKELDVDIDGLEQTKKTLIREIINLKIQRDSVNFEVNGLVNKIVSLKDEYSREFKELEVKLFIERSAGSESIAKEIGKLTLNVSNLKEEATKLDKVITDKKGEVFKFDNEIEELIGKKTKLILEISSLEEKKAEINKLTQQEVTLKISVKELQQIQNELIISNNQVQIRLEAIKNDIVIKKTEFEKNVKEKEQELEIREGNVSDKGNRLKEKEETLRATKSELEKFYNRPITNVII